MVETAEERAKQIIEDFELFDNWEDRYRYLIDIGRELPPLDEAAKTEENRVHGCQSNVWMVAQVREENGRRVIDFIADSDAHIVKGLIAILRRVYSGEPAEVILDFDIEGLLERLGLSQHLSLGRRNGLAGMVKRIKTLARESLP
jgi:cysteine desulfuration protein SufE